MKKILALTALALCLCLLLAGCGAQAAGGGDTAATTTTAANASPYISEEQALAAAEAHFSIKAGTEDEQTGFLISYMVMQGPTEELPRYKVAMRWLVEVNGTPSNWSTLDIVEIDAKTGAVVSEA